MAPSDNNIADPEVNLQETGKLSFAAENKPEVPELASLFASLSEYFRFLIEWSGCSPGDGTTNLFAQGVQLNREPLNDAIPVLKFKEAVDELEDTLKEHPSTPSPGQTDNIKNHLRRLQTLSAMASQQYDKSGGLDILDQQVNLLRAILALLPLSLPERNMPLLGLGKALAARFEHTKDLRDLDRTISYYGSIKLIRIDPYIRVQELSRCLMMRARITHNIADLENAANVLKEIVTNMPVSHPYRHICLNNLGYLMMEQYDQDPSTCAFALADAISYYKEALDLRPELPVTTQDPLPSMISSLAVAMIKRHEKTKVPVSAEDTVYLFQKLLSTDCQTNLEIYERPIHLLTRLLSLASDKKFSDDGLSVIRKFVNLEISSDIQRSIVLNTFCKLLMDRFGKTDDPQDLDEAIAVYRDALRFPLLNESVREKAGSLNILAGLLVNRFKITGTQDDAQEARFVYQDMLLMLTEKEDPMVRNTMKEYAELLSLLFQKYSKAEDVEEAIALYHAALVLVPDVDSNDRFDLLFELAETLLLQTGIMNEDEKLFRVKIEEAMYHLRAAIVLPSVDPERITEARRMLGACLLARYEETHDPTDLNESVEFSGNEEYDLRSDLQTSKISDIGNIRDPQELEEVIKTYRKVLSLQPRPHPWRPDTLVHLGRALASMFKIGGRKNQLDEAILHLREAIILAPKSVTGLITLADVIFQKAQLEEFKSKSYTDEVMALVRRSLPLFPRNVSGVVDKYMGLLHKQLESDDQDALNAIELIREVNAESVTRDPFDAARSMAFVLGMTFKISEDMKDLDESIHYAREAVTVCPDDHPHRSVAFHDLGSKLFARYNALKNSDDLEEALNSYLMSVKVLPAGNYYQCLYLGDLGIALIHKLKYLKDEVEIFDMLSQISAIFEAGAIESTSSPVPVRFRAAKVWALIADACNHESALEAYDLAISFLPRLSSMASNVTAKQEAFKVYKIDGLSRNAALFAIRNGSYGKAIEYLEAGRAVFWLQALQLRTPMDELIDASPELGEKLSSISTELDKASLKVDSPQAPSFTEKHIREEEIYKLDQLNDEWMKTLDEIRHLDGFEDFLLPKKISSLQASADDPVIFLVPDEKESHALVMLSNRVNHVHLPKSTYESLQRLVASLPGSRRRSMRVMRGIRSELLDEADELHSAKDNTMSYDGAERGGRLADEKKKINGEDYMRHVLQTIWNDIVLPIVLALGLNADNAPLKVLWCPTGIFSFLPIHAAGVYNEDMSSIDSATSYLISSYTPTVGALMNNQSSSHSSDDFKMMVVIDQKTLPNTIHEMKAIKRLVHPDCLITFGTEQSPALVESVAFNLSGVSIAHFACHGIQLTDRPLESALLLQDGNLQISRIMEQRMSNAAFAFLCACETAMGDKDLPDEAMHLGATLLFSGFRGVVATMWSIDDEDGPAVANTFYSHLFKDDSKKPNTALAAEALHRSTEELRERAVAFKRWVPFIHIGN